MSTSLELLQKGRIDKLLKKQYKLLDGRVLMLKDILQTIPYNKNIWIKKVQCKACRDLQHKVGEYNHEQREITVYMLDLPECSIEIPKIVFNYL